MSYLIDTNVLSELRRPRANPKVVSWFSERPASTLYLSVLTLGEIRKGIETMATSARRQMLLDWLEQELPKFFAGRILIIDSRVADQWGRLLALAARPLPAIDSLLAATAISHDLTLVTRNVADFNLPSLKVVNPWDEAAAP